MILYLIAGVVVLVIAIVLAVRWYLAHKTAKAKAKRLKRQAPILKWVEAIEAAKTDEEIVKLGPADTHIYLSLDDIDRQNAANRKYAAALRRNQSRTFYQNKVQKVGQFYELAELCIEAFERELDLKIALALDETTQTAGELFGKSLRVVLRLAREGDLVALHAYSTVMRSMYLNKFCKELEVTQPSFPADWNDIIAKFVKWPVVTDFYTPDALTIEQFVEIAERAVRTGSMTDAKMAFAYCQKAGRDTKQWMDFGEDDYAACTVTVETDRYFYREAIGPLLVAELIKLVGQTNAELDTWVKNFAQ